MATLHLPACPICGATDSLVSQPRERSAYACQECGSVLVWLGDDFWLQGDRWVLQHVGREDMRHLQHRPLTVAELRDLAKNAGKAAGDAGARRSRPVDAEVVEASGDLEENGEVVDATFTVLPPAERDRQKDVESPGDAWGPDQAEPGSGPEAALVPVAQALPEGLALAIVRYEGSQAVPVAVFEEGELRALDAEGRKRPRRRRGRGSPLLVIGVGSTLMCLLCALVVMLMPVLRDSRFWLGAAPISSPPASSPISDVPASAVIQGSNDYISGTGSRIIVGEVLNTAAYPLSFVQIMARFYDDAGQPAGSGATFVELATLDPGGTAPFTLDTQGLPPYSRYELHVASTAAAGEPLRLEVSNQQASAAETGDYSITGEVRNPHEFPVRFAEVVATYYNSSNQVLRVQIVMAKAETLEPGQAAPFELILPNPPADLSHYKLQTQAVRP